MRLLLTQGNALKIPLADESVHMVCTSPPYWGLRDYGTATWEGGDSECDHKPDKEWLTKNFTSSSSIGKAVLGNDAQYKAATARWYKDGACRKCGALRIDNQLGLEPTPEEYVANMVAVFREVRRVLRDDGQLFLNISDTRTKTREWAGIPHHLVDGLREDGWRYEDEVVWFKKNPMPESQTNRFTRAHEFVFLLNKTRRAYFDADAVREGNQIYTRKANAELTNNPRHANTLFFKDTTTVGRNRRTVWHIATAPYSGAHFATYPPALVEPCIKAGTSERGVCPECGKPWERVVEKGDLVGRTEGDGKGYELPKAGKEGFYPKATETYKPNFRRETTTLGWRPTCEHDHEPTPATVFDPFAGSGTSLQVARALGRNGVGLDLSLEYLHLARQRLSLDALDAWGKGKKDGATVTDLPMFEGLE